MSVIILDSKNFNELIQSDEKTILVDFYADWCVPCKMIAPIMEEISEENEKILVCKVNITDNPDVAVEYGIQSIPFIASFKNGSLYKKAVGVQPKENLLKLVD